VSAHDLSGEGIEERLAPVVRQAATEFGHAPDSTFTLLNVSENATYAVDDSDSGERTVLRVHRRGYHDAAAIRSELAWLDAVRVETGLRTPGVLPAPDGQRVLAIGTADDPEPRHVVRFEWLDGAEPDPADESLPEWFGLLGAVTARLHQHARAWRRPSGFRRFAWDYDAAFGSVARWGRWQDGMALGAAELGILTRLDEALRERLAAYGKGPERYGLIHADLRLANLLVHEGETRVIDFDDAGDGLFLYDFGSAVSFFEDDPRMPELIDAWASGYRSVATLPAQDEAEIPTFVMMRRLLLLAWIGSHAGTDLARSTGAAYTAGTCELAETYLTRM